MQYTKNPPLLEGNLQRNPLEQFERWLADAVRAQIHEPTAMTLATVDARGRPHARIVLFKGFRDGGFAFYTNYQSAKGKQLAETGRAALVFWWDKLERSVRVEGKVRKLSRQDALEYFRSRPRVSQIGAIVSRQSHVVKTREELDGRYRMIDEELEGREVPLPRHWGGYRLLPESIEFWQGRHGRLHDRLRYRRQGKRWRIERLEP